MIHARQITTRLLWYRYQHLIVEGYGPTNDEEPEAKEETQTHEITDQEVRRDIRCGKGISMTNSQRKQKQQQSNTG